VLKSAFELLMERGFDEFSIGDVAARSGVHETSIYRRYKSRSKLALQASLDVVEAALPVPETGSLRRDLIDFVRRIVALLRSPSGAALLSLLAAQTPDLIPAREAFWRKRFESALVILQRARARGEITRDIDEMLFLETLVAPIHFRALIWRGKINKLSADDLVDRHLRAFRITSRSRL
jgi:AcrR family transcriptional regulator